MGSTVRACHGCLRKEGISRPAPAGIPARAGRSGGLCAFVQSGHDELAVSQGLCGGQAAVAGADHHIQEHVAGLVHVDLAAQQAGNVDVKVL